MNQTVFDRDQAELLVGLIAALLISVHRSDMTLVADRNPDHMEFSVATAGNQQPILFLVLVSLIIDWDRTHRLNSFTEYRTELEEFLFRNLCVANC